RVAAELRTLPPLMSGLRAYHAGPDAGLTDGNFDFAVVADFDDEESFIAYREHPAHKAVVAECIAPIRQDRASVQYEICRSARTDSGEPRRARPSQSSHCGDRSSAPCAAKRS